MKLVYSLLAALIVPALPARAITISLVYQNPDDPFFTEQVQETLNKAAADVSYAITTTLAALSQDVYVGTNGSTSSTVNWSLSYINPTDGLSLITLDTFNLAETEFRIFVGSRALSGDTLGVGGAGGVGLSINYAGNGAQFQGAVDNMAAASDDGMVRDGPVRGTISGNLSYDGATAPFSLTHGYTIGSLSFASAADWHFDYETLPGISQSDFYSVAAHEILHTIGFGTGEQWNAHLDGRQWNGSAVNSLLGVGATVISEDLAHVALDLQGRPLIDGAFDMETLQDALMGPSIAQGTRKYITDLELAFLQDMNWNVVPEPSTSMLAGLAFGTIFFRRRRG